MDQKETHGIFFECVKILLRPILRFCLKHSISLAELTALSKQTIVELAAQQIKAKGQELSLSRLSIMTGLTRRETKKYWQGRKRAVVEPASFAHRIIDKWRRDPQFQNRKGEPRVLDYEGMHSSFSKLVRSISADLNPYAALFELERTETVEKTEKGLTLKKEAFIQTENLREGMRVLASDVEDLMLAVQENLAHPNELRNYHLVTEYDQIVPEAVPTIRLWLLEQGTLFHQKVRNYLAQFDRETNPELKKGRKAARVMFGGYSRISDDSK